MSGDLPDFLYGTAWKEARTARLVELALGAGFRGIDTANQRKHYFEAAVGEGLAAAYRAGLVRRGDLFLQTKFTSRAGQDDRLPYDPRAGLPEQVARSLASSLEHLRTDRVDSYLMHGPASGDGWVEEDSEVWLAMGKERAAGRTRQIGLSNVSARHLEQMLDLGLAVPDFVQNRCYARQGWDRQVRERCRARGIVYQGFSLLTANPRVLSHPIVAGIARRLQATPAQVVFRFARGVGILPLTGTSDPEHMRQDLASARLELSEEELAAIEALGG